MEKWLYVINNWGNIIITILPFVGRFIKSKLICKVVLILSLAVNATYFYAAPDGWLGRVYSIILIVVTIYILIVVIKNDNNETNLEIPVDLLEKNGFKLDGVSEEKITITMDDIKHFNTSLIQARSGDPMGMYNVACCYANGTGTDINMIEAVKWAKKLTMDKEVFWSNEGKTLLLNFKNQIKSNCKLDAEDALELIELILK